MNNESGSFKRNVIEMCVLALLVLWVLIYGKLQTDMMHSFFGGSDVLLAILLAFLHVVIALVFIFLMRRYYGILFGLINLAHLAWSVVLFTEIPIDAGYICWAIAPVVGDFVAFLPILFVFRKRKPKLQVNK